MIINSMRKTLCEELNNLIILYNIDKQVQRFLVKVVGETLTINMAIP